MDLLASLNAQQREAATHPRGPAITLAGPGAGKTKLLANRAAWLVSQNIRPEAILMLSFTNKSAKELMDRIHALDPRSQGVQGGTFHAIAIRIINQNHPLFGRSKPFTVLDKSEVSDLYKKLIAQTKAKSDDRNWPTPGSFRDVISFAANTLLPLEEATAQKHGEMVAWISEIEEIRNAYVKYKVARGLIDFDDVLTFFAHLLEHPQIGPQLRTRWSHIHVDEYQDSNNLQLRIIHALAGEEANVMIVGDPGQSIYSFRGSAPATMARFLRQYPTSQIYNLETNYRSSGEIIDIVNAVDKSMALPFQRTLRSHRGPSGVSPLIIEVPDDGTQAASLADAIIEAKDRGIELKQNAVLVRSMSYARRIEAEFIQRKIPYVCIGGIQIDEAAHVKDLLSIARVTLSPGHEIAWHRLLKRYRKIGDASAEKIASKLIHLTDPAAICSTLIQQAFAHKTTFNGLVEAIHTFASTDTPGNQVERVIRIMEPFWKEYPEWQASWTERRNDLNAIRAIADEHHTLESFLSTVTVEHKIDKRAVQESEKDLELPVTISTIHGAKGLEWDIVHIPSFVQGHIPSNYAVSPESKAEELRVFYVAISRPATELRFYKPAMAASGAYFHNTSPYQAIIAPYVQVQRPTPVSPHHAGPLQMNGIINIEDILLNRA